MCIAAMKKDSIITSGARMIASKSAACGSRPSKSRACLRRIPQWSKRQWSRLTTIKQDNQPSVINAVTYDGDNIWVVGAKGLIARSSDEGRTFNAIPSAVDVGLNDVTVRGERIAIVGDQGTILRSTDGGRSFVRSNYSLRYREGQPGGVVDLYSVQFIDKDTGYIV